MPQLLNFANTQIAIVTHNDDFWMTSESIGLALEYEEPRDAILKIYERHRDELDEYSTTVKLTAADGKQRDVRGFNEEGVMLICMFSRQPQARVFRKWAVKVLKNYRHGQNADPEKALLLKQAIDLQRQLITAQKETAALRRIEYGMLLMNGLVPLIPIARQQTRRRYRKRKKV